MTRLIKFTAFYHTLIGLSMLMMWVMFYVTNQIPELETAPFAIAMHLIAELTTALLLMLSGLLLFRNHSKAIVVYACAYGALLYSVVNSSGYFMQPFDIAMVTMFAVIFISTTLLFIGNLKNFQK
jgi:hypothetical protein